MPSLSRPRRTQRAPQLPNVNLLRAILHDLALVCLVAAGALGCAVLWKTMGTVDAVNATLVNVNRPCKGPDGPDACGTLAQINKGVIRMDDLATTAQMQVKQSGLLITATTQNMDKVATSVTGEVSALQDTTKALTKTAQTASTSLQTLTDDISPVLASTNAAVGQIGATVAGLQPVEKAATKVEKAATKSFTDIDALALNPNWPQLIENAQKVSGEFVTTVGTTNHMLFTFDAVETKATHSYLNPPHGAAAIWPTVKPFILPAVQVTGAVAIEVAK